MSDLQLLSSRAVVGLYYAALEADPGTNWLNAISNEFGSDQAGETYVFLGQSPAFREWIGGRQAKGFSGNGITIFNKHYESTLEIRKTDARRDKTGQISARLGEWGQRGQTHWASLLSTAVINGATTVCYDGQYFFDTDHSEGASGVQSNKIDADISTYPATLHGSTTDPSVEEMQQAIIAGIIKIVSYLDDKGEPLNENANAFLVMVPIGLMKAARGAVSSLTPAMLQQNFNPDAFADFKVRVVMNVRLTAAGWTDKFVVFREDSPIKALIRQTEQEIELKVKAEGSEYEFDNDAWQFGLDGWRGAGYGYWQRAVQVTLI